MSARSSLCACNSRLRVYESLPRRNGVYTRKPKVHRMPRATKRGRKMMRNCARAKNRRTCRLLGVATTWRRRRQTSSGRNQRTRKKIWATQIGEKKNMSGGKRLETTREYDDETRYKNEHKCARVSARGGGERHSLCSRARAHNTRNREI